MLFRSSGADDVVTVAVALLEGSDDVVAVCGAPAVAEIKTLEDNVLVCVTLEAIDVLDGSDGKTMGDCPYRELMDRIIASLYSRSVMLLLRAVSAYAYPNISVLLASSLEYKAPLILWKGVSGVVLSTSWPICIV